MKCPRCDGSGCSYCVFCGLVTDAQPVQPERPKHRWRPILFRAEMVRALLEGRKTQTRRLVKPQPVGDTALRELLPGIGIWALPLGPELVPRLSEKPVEAFMDICCPFGEPGDRLWVRETWYCDHDDVQRGPYKEVRGAREAVVYAADSDTPYEAEQPIWRPSIHMPRWASRITLEVVSVRVERLQAMEGQHDLDSDALAEGVRRIHHGDGEYYYSAFRDEPDGANWYAPTDAFKELWERINGPGSWDANPWVWVVEFKRIEA